MIPFLMLPGSPLGPRIPKDAPSFHYGLIIGGLLAQIWIMLSGLIYIGLTGGLTGNQCFDAWFHHDCHPGPWWCAECSWWPVIVWIGVALLLWAGAVIVAVRTDS